MPNDPADSIIKVVIIDDEPLARSVIREYLQLYPSIQVVEECGDGFEGVKAIATHQPNLVFLDIQMPKINGFEMLELLDEPPAVIFTTAFDEYAMQAFEAHAIDYLLKPFSKERFDKAIQKWSNQKPRTEVAQLLENVVRQPEETNRIVVKAGSAIRILPVKEVHYLEAYDDYVKIHTKDGFYLKKKTMNYFEKTLDASLFVRVHRSFLLNLQELTRIELKEKETHVAKMRSGAIVPLSKSGYSKLREILNV